MGRLEGVDVWARVSRENARTVVVVVVGVLTVVDQLVDAWSESWRLSYTQRPNPSSSPYIFFTFFLSN